MKKEQIIAENKIVSKAYEIAEKEFVKVVQFSDNYTTERLRSCSARVYTTKNYRFLVSYNTMVAFISLNDGNGYDVLRKVYGYTATSAQHISKFFHDYAAQKTYRFN